MSHLRFSVALKVLCLRRGTGLNFSLCSRIPVSSSQSLAYSSLNNLHVNQVDILQGEMLDERCVVVYKATSLPKDVAIKLNMYEATAADEAAAAAEAQEAHARSAAFKAAAAAAAKADAAGGAGAAVAETRKRDRRTVGEIMRATEHAKRAAHGNSDGGSGNDRVGE